VINFVTIIGISASACTAVSLMPQLFKLIKEKKAQDLSLWMLFVLLAGLSMWIYYGILKTDPIIIISNSISAVINILIVLFTFKYK
jgi:MtN3 and saliva related transmembrane protein